MSKVIDMHTRKEVTETFFQRDAALAFVEHLIKFKIGDLKSITVAERRLAGYLFDYIANAAGVTPEELYQEAKHKIEFSTKKGEANEKVS
jgi:hypothetical protein